MYVEFVAGEFCICSDLNAENWTKCHEDNEGGVIEDGSESVLRHGEVKGVAISMLGQCPPETTPRDDNKNIKMKFKSWTEFRLLFPFAPLPLCPFAPLFPPPDKFLKKRVEISTIG
jgi:hypothetical protein